MFTRWENQAFNVTTMFASGENVAVFGDFRYKSHSLGKVVSSPFSILVKVVDGKVTYLQFLEDSYATAASFRKDGSWTVQTRGRRRAVPGLTFRITGSAPVRADTAPERRCHLNHRVIGIFGLCPKEPTRVPRSRR